MIKAQRQLFYFVGDKPYSSLIEAQKADLTALMGEDLFDAPSGERLATWMLDNAKEIVDTLTTTPRSRLKARKLHGGTRKPRTRKATPAATPA